MLVTEETLHEILTKGITVDTYSRTFKVIIFANNPRDAAYHAFRFDQTYMPTKGKKVNSLRSKYRIPKKKFYVIVLELDVSKYRGEWEEDQRYPGRDIIIRDDLKPYDFIRIHTYSTKRGIFFDMTEALKSPFINNFVRKIHYPRRFWHLLNSIKKRFLTSH